LMWALFARSAMPALVVPIVPRLFTMAALC